MRFKILDSHARDVYTLKVHVCFLKHYHLTAYLVWYFQSLYNNDMFEVKGVYNAFPNSIVLPQDFAHESVNFNVINFVL